MKYVAELGVKGTLGARVKDFHADITGKPGDLTYSGKATLEAYAQLGPFATMLGVTGELHLTAAIRDQIVVDSSGMATVDATFAGSAGGSISIVGWSLNIPEKDLGSTPPLHWSFDVAGFYELAKQRSGIGAMAEAAESVDTGVPVVAIEPRELVVITQPPTTVVAGQGFGLVVAAKNRWGGDIDTSFNGSVTVNDGDQPGELGGVTTVTAVNGVATFTGLTYTQAANDHTLYAETSSGFIGWAMTDWFSVIAAPASQFVFTQTPWWADDYSFSVLIDARDPFGNLDENYGGNVTLALAGNSNGATLGGTLTVAANKGHASFWNVMLEGLPGDYCLEASAPGLSGVMDPERFIELLPSDFVATHLVLTTPPPSSVVAGAPFEMVVAALDQEGKVDTTFNSSVVLSGETGATDFGAPRRVKAVNGVATFTDLTYTRATSANNKRELLANSYVGGVWIDWISVVAEPATRLAFDEMPPWRAASDTPFTVLVGAYDRYGNLDTTYAGNVTVALVERSKAATLGGTLTVSAAGGQAAFSDLTIDLAGQYHLEASAPGLSGVTMEFNYIEIVPGEASRLVILPPVADIVMGKPFDVDVQATDAAGNATDSYSGAITLSLDNNPTGATLGGTLTQSTTSGSASFTGLVIDKPGSGYTLRATGPGLAAGIRPAFDVAPLHLVIPTPSASIATGAPFSLQVSVRNSDGTLDPDFAGPVTLSLKSNLSGAKLSGNLTVNAVRGMATFSGLSIDKPGSGYTLQATSPNMAAKIGPRFDVTNKVLVVTTQPPATVTAGSDFGLVVKAVDGAGKVDTSFNGIVTLTDPGARGTLGGTLTQTAVNGVATFSDLRLNQAGLYHWLIATSSSLPSVKSQRFEVVPAAASRLALVASPGKKVSTSAPFEVQVAAEDSLGNVRADFHGTVSIALADNPTGATLGGTLTATAVDGVATFPNLAVNKDGSGYTLRATAEGLVAATSSTFDAMRAGAATQLVVTTQPSTVAAGSSFELVISAKDGFGAVDANFNGDVTLTAPLYTNLAGTLTVKAVGGVATFTGLSLNRADSDVTLTASSTEIRPATTDAFTVTALAATRLTVWGPFSNALNGSDFGLTVRAEDQYGNVDTSFGGDVTLAWENNPSGAALSGELTVAAIEGRARFSGLSIDKLGTGYTLSAQGANLTGATSEPFDVTTDELLAAPELPGAVPIGTAFGFAVMAADASGNFDASFDGIVTVSLLDWEDTGATLGGTLAVTAVGGVATFSGLTLDKAGEYALLVTGNGVGGTVTRSCAVIAGVVPDTTPPTSRVDALPAYERRTFTVSWSGADGAQGSGVATYSVYVSDNGGSFKPWRTNTAETSAAFTGQNGHRYGFYCVATDKAGNVQNKPSAAQTKTIVDAVVPTSRVAALPAVVRSLRFTVRWSGSEAKSGSGIAGYTIYVSDNGGSYVPWLSNTKRKSASFKGVNGHTYRFYCVGTDKAGNVQQTPRAAQAKTKVVVRRAPVRASVNDKALMAFLAEPGNTSLRQATLFGTWNDAG